MCWMECLFYSSSSCLLILVTLAMECFFMYGWNFFMYEMMDGTCLCMKWWMDLVCVWNDVWTCLCDECLWNISICHIYFLCKLWDLTKNRKNRQYAGSLPCATDGKEPLPSAADGKEATWQPTVLPGSWPIWSVCLQWQTAKTLPSVADGKESVADGKEPAI